MFIFFRKEKLSDKIDELCNKLNESNFTKFAEILVSPKRLFLRGFLVGIAKGIGGAIGFSLLGALLIYLLRYIVMLNLPVIGAFVRDVLEIAGLVS